MQASCASSSIQHRNPEDTVPSERDPRSSVRPGKDVNANALETWPAPPARPAEDTIPYANPMKTAARLFFGKGRKKIPMLDDEESTESGRPIPDWCVDDGAGLRAMTTFELWMALARGEIGPRAQVWRDGMEGWDRIEDVPELAYALTDSVSFDPPLVTPAPLGTPSPLRGRVEGRTPLTFSNAEAETGDPPEVHEPSAEPLSSEPISLPVRVWKLGRRVRSGLAPAKQGSFAFAMGCVVAVAAVGLALVHQGVGPEAIRAAGVVAEPKVVLSGVGAPLVHAGQRARDAGVRPVESVYVAPPPPPARKHTDPGQRRSRRSPRR